MAKDKNKKYEKVILENVPSESVKWLKQPYNLTFLRGELSMSQLNILVELVNQLQERIEESLSMGNTLFSNEDYDPYSRVEVRVPLKLITNHSTKYSDVEDVAKMLFNGFNVERLTKNKDGKDSIDYVHVFHSLQIPRRNGDTGYRKSYLEFKIDKDMIDSVFSLNRYHQYIKRIAKNRRSAFTSRIYMFITAFRKFGVWKPTYDELHKLLGFTMYEKGEWVVKKYPIYRHFKRKVLKVAHDELKELADSGQVDCYFEFEEEYPEGGKKSTDNPYKIIFNIYTTDFGKDVETKTSFNKKWIDIEGMMRNDFDLKTSQILQLKKLVDADNADYLLSKMEELKLWMKDHKKEVVDAQKYVVKSLRNVLMDLIPVAEEVKENGERKSKGADDAKDKMVEDWDRREKFMRDKWMDLVGHGPYLMYLSVVEIKADGDKVVGIAQHPDTKSWMEQVGLEKLGLDEVRVGKNKFSFS